MKVKSDHRSEFSNLSNWKVEALKNIRASTGAKPKIRAPNSHNVVKYSFHIYTKIEKMETLITIRKTPINDNNNPTNDIKFEVYFL